MKNLMGVWSDCPHSWQERQKLMNCEMYSEGFKEAMPGTPSPLPPFLFVMLDAPYMLTLTLGFVEI
jgi:hypothetical protein